jgi:hypothetical protein
MALVKGNRYKRADFGIHFPRSLFSQAIVNGEIYFFITIDNRRNNELKNGYIIHEPNKQSEVRKQKETITQIMHTFVRDRKAGEKEFEYFGILDTVENYDQKRNKLTIK